MAFDCWEFSREAIADIDRVAAYLTQDYLRGKEKADNYKSTLERTQLMLCENPHMGQLFVDSRDEFKNIYFFAPASWMILYYRIGSGSSNRIRVVRVLSSRQDQDAVRRGILT